MGKVILVCGKMGSGKTTYARGLANEINAVVIEHDEIMLGLFGGELYANDKELFFKYHVWVDEYTKRMAREAAKAGATVIFANGFWSRAERDELRNVYAKMGIPCELHYIDTYEEQRRKNIQKRNEEIQQGKPGYILNNKKDVNHFFEVPENAEITRIVTLEKII